MKITITLPWWYNEKCWNQYQRVHESLLPIWYHIMYWLETGSCYFPAASCTPVCNLKSGQYPETASNLCNFKHLHQTHRYWINIGQNGTVHNPNRCIGRVARWGPTAALIRFIGPSFISQCAGRGRPTRPKQTQWSISSPHLPDSCAH